MAVISFKCPHCDGELIFDPAKQNYKCEYCMSSFTQQELNSMTPKKSTERNVGASSSYVENERETAERNGASGTPQSEAKMYHCPSCGAEIITDATTAATFCYYCHNPVILGGRLEGEFLPDKIIPFEIPKEEAVKRFLTFVGRKKFVPKAFFCKEQIESITGVYFPYWNYNVHLDGELQGEGKNVRTWVTGDIQYTETKYYDIQRAGKVSFSNMTENALKKANAELASGVMPYDFDKMQDFNMSYLSGFFAEKRDIEKETLSDEMRQSARDYTSKMLRGTIDEYGFLSIESSWTRITNEKWMYCLLPVWTITYKGDDGKIYYYSMNGQTGEVCGDLPVDRKKLSLVSLAVSIAIMIIGLLGGYLS